MKREREGRLERKCPFCRKAPPTAKEEINERLMQRIEANDPVAMCSMGMIRKQEGDYKAAFEYWAKAAALEDVAAHYQQLSCLYRKGECVEKDEERELYHLEQAAIGGHPRARHNLGCFEGLNGQHNRAAKNYIISAKLGCDASLRGVIILFKDGYVSKEDFATALRGYHAAIFATKSPQREEAGKFDERLAERKRRGI